MAEIFYKVTQQKTDRGLDTKNWSRFVLKIARDYAENAPKAERALVIYRFRNEQHVFYARVFYGIATAAVRARLEECDCDPLFLGSRVPKMLCIMSISSSQIC